MDTAPSGIWEIEASANLVSGTKIEAWIQRDDSPLGYRSAGRQSYFDDEVYERFDELGDLQIEDNASTVKRAGTLSGIATGASFVVLGGYQGRDKELSLYSASGSDAIRHPDASATSDTSRSLGGILGAGNRSGSVAAISGTSVAVPQAVRWIAAEVAKPGNREGFVAAEFVSGLATTSEAELLSAGYDGVPTERSGHGRLPVHPDLVFQTNRQ